MTNEQHSASKKISSIADHHCPSHVTVITPDGECVCSRCGVVIISDAVGESLQPHVPGPKSNINLFLAHQLGGSRVRSLPMLSTVRSIEIASRERGREQKEEGNRKDGDSDSGGTESAISGAYQYLSCFSNACVSMGLTHAETEYGWQLFVKLYRELGSSNSSNSGKNGRWSGRVNVAEVACYAIAASVATNTASATSPRLLNELALARAVSYSFNRKSIRDLYYIRRVIETRVALQQQENAPIPLPLPARPTLTSSAKWVTGRY